MAQHPNVEILHQAYDAVHAGNVAAAAAIFDDGIVWHALGHNQLTGDYIGKPAVAGFFAKLRELTGGTFSEEVHDILANDEHAAVMVTVTARRPDGRTWAGRQVHIWHLRDGKATEFWMFTDDDAARDDFYA